MSNPQQALTGQPDSQIKALTQALTEAQNQQQRWAKYMDTSAQISRAIASTLDIDSLGTAIVEHIKNGFGAYQVAIFLVDNSGQWAVLHQATGKAGRTMKREGYRLPIDDESIIGWVNRHQKPCFYYFQHKVDQYYDSPPPALARHPMEMVLPLVVNGQLAGTLQIQSAAGATFQPDDVSALQSIADQVASAIEKWQLYTEVNTERDRNTLLKEISDALSKDLDFDAITTTAVGFAHRLGATSGEIHLLADTGEVYFKSSYPERNDLSDPKRQQVVRQILGKGLEAWVLEHNQPALITDTLTDDRWLKIEYSDQKVSVRSIICSPIRVGTQLKGAISFVHSEPHHFTHQDMTRLATLASRMAVALENTMLVNDIQHSLQETHLMLDISRQLAAALNINDVYAALVKSVMGAGVDRSALFMCDELGTSNIPSHSEIVFVSDAARAGTKGKGQRIAMAEFPLFAEIARSQETLVINDVALDNRLNEKERNFFLKANAHSVVVNPLVARGRVIGLITIEYRTPYNFDERKLAMYRTLCNQTTIAIENTRQIEYSQTALAETQLLYRAGRVLAGAADVQEVLEEALIEFLYSLNLDQGAITLLTDEGKFGQLMVYVQNSEVQNTEGLRFPVDVSIPYQQILLQGQPFSSYDVANDPRLVNFRSFNPDLMPKSLLESPLIIQGETIGWIGADSVKEHRQFSQREIDLARAMADQIAITIENRRLLEQTERRADQLRVVADVGESISRMIDLEEILNNTVDLIRDRFGFYHVSIFLLNNTREWAVVNASTGEVGKIMVERPHKLEVGGKSIVGFVTASGTPRIALDVGVDAVHFNNPLLPNTRSEMALPLIARGLVIGALDVQSNIANAFGNDDIETLQVMADQLASAIENARLFEQTQRRLIEQATLYGIGAKIGSTLNLQEATNNLVQETASALECTECALTMIQGNTLHTISAYAGRNAESTIINYRNEYFNLSDSAYLSKIIRSKQEIIYHIDSPRPISQDSPEFSYLESCGGTALAAVPVLLRNDVIAVLEVYDNKPGRRFLQENISLLDSIALQAANTIENARLFQSSQYRSNLLQTAAEVSRTASSILDVDTLIQTVVNLIRDRFDFYYVGLFLIDEADKYAVLTAGTGEAGRLQVDKGHKLEIGGGSMIGWSVEHRQARIALDVGEDAVWFNNPYLPNTHSEMALPLISREQVIGALTVQSEKRSAFSDEDIILLQTMADQVANAIQNARFFTQTQTALSETEQLYKITQELLSVRDEENVYQVAIEAIADSGVDSSAIYMYIDDLTGTSTEPIIEQKAIWANTGNPIFPNGTRFKASEMVLEQLVSLHETVLIEDIDNDPRLTPQVRKSLSMIQIKSVQVIPLSTYQNRLGFLLIAYKTTDKTFSKEQNRYFHTIVQQMVVAIENLRLLGASQRRARREEIIRDITGKIRSTTNIDDILKTTVSELGKVVGAPRGGVILTLDRASKSREKSKPQTAKDSRR